MKRHCLCCLLWFAPSNRLEYLDVLVTRSEQTTRYTLERMNNSPALELRGGLHRRQQKGIVGRAGQYTVKNHI